jgi:hypothetical protein
MFLTWFTLSATEAMSRCRLSWGPNIFQLSKIVISLIETQYSTSVQGSVLGPQFSMLFIFTNGRSLARSPLINVLI